MDESPNQHEEQLTPVRMSEVLAAGTVVAGRYTIIQHLAAGGMGRVYIATQSPLGRKVALKIMHSDLCKDEGSVKRFMREAIAISQLTHPNTITVFDYGESGRGDLFYIAMELLEGEPLSERVKRQGPLPPETAVGIAIQVAKSLSEAHRKNIIHRDLKPENVFLGSVERDLVKVLDFGIAKILQEENEGTKLTRMGFVCGTPEYMSPEQARGEDLDGRSDLYSLGVLLYEVISGKPPFEESTPLATVLMHQAKPPPPLPPSVPPLLAEFIIDCAMAKDPKNRPANAEAFIEALEQAAMASGLMMDSTGGFQTSDFRRSLHSGPNNLAAATTPVEFPESGKSNKGLLIGASLFLIIACGAIAAVLLSNGEKGNNDTTAQAATAADTKAPATDPKNPVVNEAPKATKEAPPITLTLSSTPQAASVFEGDELLGLTPFELPLHEGNLTRTFKFALEGYAPASQMVAIPSIGKEPFVMSSHVELAPLLNVPIASVPPGAMVFIDDEAIGETPLVHATEPHQRINLLFELEGYDPHTQELVIDSENPIQVELQKERKKLVKKEHPKNPRKEPTTEPEVNKNDGGGSTYRPFGD
ncbi:MAG: hypothetical protein AUK47_04935 [Deltaproteobacteria bacterium CG2_30_63_29]|nr:MAG: hypothetical protein AUK47_04935 [Deltaproteobacteria bacterium CG2_30_63_29]PJB46150.1 MAG: hypothetical protein CO108_06180 [Deltaproteobacteria bacterium CG_4_9_14_3_um_filter_63_12]